MCGIAGIGDFTLPPAAMRPILERMTGSIIHRGPDAEGFFCSRGVGLGIRRLSIIDLEGGNQPIASEDGQIQVVFNGEIYNYPYLRAELEKRGHIFRTRSDTEVIVHSYEEHGPACLQELRGMFGIALWDQRRRRLLLGRDRLGKKPLFYAHQGNRLLFGSEIKTLLAADPALADPDPQATPAYFRFGFVPEPKTMFRRIRKLPAAHYLLYEDGKISITPYWSLNFEASEKAGPSSEQWLAELDALLEEAVRIRLMSDVPLGVFLSGGIDSSTVVAYAHKAGLRPLKTFTIAFDRKEWDESASAALVARHFGTDHHVLKLHEADLTQDLPGTLLNLVRHFDEPFGDSSSLPTYHVCRLARQHAKVILGGDGGDELFAGYSIHQGIRFAELYRRLPPWLGQKLLPAMAQAAAGLAPGRWRYRARRAVKVLQDSSLPLEAMYFSKIALCPDSLLWQLFNGDYLTTLGQPENTWPANISAIMRTDLPILSKVSYADIRFRLLDDMLVKVDRMSMANSLEVRSPFLDHRLVELSTRMPPEMKLRGGRTKVILREVVKKYLPPATLRKRKQGFSVPLREWLRTKLRETVGDYLEGGGLPAAMFNQPTIKGLLRQHYQGEADYSQVIWLLLNYAAWRHLYLSPGSS